MDQELKAHLEMMEARMEARMNEREARLESHMDERFVRMEERFDAKLAGLEGRMEERFERVETEARHTRVIVEGMDDKIRLLAEAFVGTHERIVALREETTDRLEEIKGSVDMIHRILVPRVQSLENRVKNLEDHVERRNVEAIDVIREKILSRPT